MGRLRLHDAVGFPATGRPMTATARPAPVAPFTAAGSGLDAASARRLAAEGWQAAILSSSGKGEAPAAKLGGLGVTGSNLVPADPQRVVDAALARDGRIDAVVNSAGHGPKGALLSIGDAYWQRGMAFDLLNVVRIARLVTPVMLGQRRGSIVNISTYAAFEPEAAFPTSGVFRAALAAFGKPCADEYAAAGLRIDNVLPCFVSSQPEKPERRARIPMGGYGTTEEVAELVAFLASERSSCITGQNIRTDGGITRHV